MEIEQARNIVVTFLETNCRFDRHLIETTLVFESVSYRIEPDDAFYYPDKILLVEYENTKRPVESISKYWWLFENTNLLEKDVQVKLLLTINRRNVNQIRTETIPILGEQLKAKYPLQFDFCFIDYKDLNNENLIAALQKLLS